MRKKQLFAMLALTTVFALGFSTGCKDEDGTTPPPINNNENLSEEVKEILLNYTNAKVDVFDSLKLEATSKNVDGKIAWSSSDPSVATVDASGLVSALKVGSAVITAEADGVKASCSITTAISTVAPIMSVSQNQLPLTVDGSYSVSVSTTWKGREMAAEYEWYLADASKQESEYVSLSVSEDGKTATFTGLLLGSETYCVSTSVNGVTLMEQIEISVVENNVYFDVTNLTANADGYVANIALIDEGEHVSFFTPEVKVYQAGVEQTGISLEWENSDDTVAVIDGNGKITGLKTGTAVFTTSVTVDGEISPLAITVNVYAPEFTYLLENKQSIDLNGEKIAKLDCLDVSAQIKGEFKSANVDGVAFANASYASGLMSFDIETIGKSYGDKTVTVQFERRNGDVVTAIEKVVAPIEVYRSISTAEQLNSLVDYLEMEGKDAYGLFRLTADIDMKGETLAGVGTYVNTGEGWTPNYCWKGTFDGQGHTVSNVVESGTNSGLFCYIASGGVVKNVYFTDVTVRGDTGFIATSNDGRVENVFVYGQFNAIQGSSGIPASMLVAKNEGVIHECFVIVDYNSLTKYGGMLAGLNNGTVTDCVAVNVSKSALYGVGSTGIASIQSSGEGGIKGVFGKSYQTLDKYFEESDEYAYDDWAVEKLNTVINANVGGSLKVNEIAKNSTAKISFKNYKFVSKCETSGTGISVKNDGTISVSNDAVVDEKVSISITYFGGTRETFSFTVAKGVIQVQEQARLDMREEFVSVDLTKYGETGSTLRSVTFGATKLDGVTLENGILKIPSSALGQGKDDWGEISLTVRTETETYQVPVFVFVSVASISDLEDMMSYAHADGMLVEGEKQDRYIYIQMTKDVDLNLYSFITTGGVWSKTYKAWTVRFAGTFDGNGHAIKNWYPCVGLSNVTGSGWNKGLFPGIAPSGVVKNVSFINATINASSLIATSSDGLIENVFVEGKIITGGVPNIPVGMIVGKNSGTVRNCVVVCTGAPDPSGSYGAMITARGGTTTNCVAINMSGETIYAVGKDSTTVAEAYEMADATNTICNSWAEYDDVKETITTDDWAEELIADARKK